MLAALADGELRDACEIAQKACPTAQQGCPERKVIQDAIDEVLPEMHHSGELIYGQREVPATVWFGDAPEPPMRVPIYMSAAAFDGE